MERGIAGGVTPPADHMRNVPDQAAAQMVTDPAASPLLERVPQVPAGDSRG